MIFSTNLFLFLFLPTFIAIYYISSKEMKSHVILAASYAFYGWWRVEFLLLIFGMSAFSFYMAKITTLSVDEKWRRAALVAGVGADLGVLAYFKYANFFVENVNNVAGFLGHSGVGVVDILLPIGISFHTFQSISYVIDVYRGDAPPARRLVDFLAFGALFPQLIAGPVLRYKDLADQFIERTHSLELFTLGVRRFFIGLGMKVLIADSIAPLADRMFALPQPTFAESWLGAFAYTFQLYFDFAGYSGMAIGLGLMIGFHFIENFNFPYISRSITEFWRRWHISLSTWLRDYLYIPLGGNRNGSVRTYVNLLLTMVLGGFWHGANWTFLCWGTWHGGLLAFERLMGGRSGETIWPRQISLALTFTLVIIGWVIFRAENLSVAMNMFNGMSGANGFWITDGVAWQVRRSELVLLSVAAVISFWPLIRIPNLFRSSGFWVSERFQAPLIGLLAIASVTRMVSQTYSPFLYFQF